MELLRTPLAFLMAIALLIVVHELGHYWAARWCGVKVLRFSVGMGHVIFSRRFGPDRTEWALSVFPIGGYVKMLDLREEDAGPIPPSELHREFTRQPVWKRMIIVAAGPAANFLLAVVLFTGLFMHGIPEPVTRLRAVLSPETAAVAAGLKGGDTIDAVNGHAVRVWSDLHWEILQAAVDKRDAELRVHRADGVEVTVIVLLKGLKADDLENDFLKKLGIELWRPKAELTKIREGAAQRAGLQTGDVVLRVNGVAVADGPALSEAVQASLGKPLTLDVRRADAEFQVTVVPDVVRENGRTVRRLGVELATAPEMILAGESLPTAAVKAVRKIWESSALTLKMLGRMVTGEVSWKNITGPITIADYAGKTASIGWVTYLGFIAFVSVSLAVMNLLPIPVLDGGLLLYYSLEVLTGRPVSERFGEIAQRAGVGILMTLMAVAIYNDVVRLLS